MAQMAQKPQTSSQQANQESRKQKFKLNYQIVYKNDFKTSVHKISFSFKKKYKASLNFVKKMCLIF